MIIAFLLTVSCLAILVIFLAKKESRAGGKTKSAIDLKTGGLIK